MPELYVLMFGDNECPRMEGTGYWSCRFVLWLASMR